MSQVAVTAVVLFSLGFKLKDEGQGGERIIFMRKQ